jgi:ATP synthase protein I
VGDAPTPLEDLGRRLKALRKETGGDGASAERRDVPRSAAGWALRVGVELVVGLVVGGGIGWVLDRWLGTSPLMLIVFFFLGAGAGMVNVFRVARAMNRDAG